MKEKKQKKSSQMRFMEGYMCHRWYSYKNEIKTQAGP